MSKIVAFICLHASAKSLIAAEYANREARRRGLDLIAVSAGPEPDAAVPPNVVEGMAGKGFDVAARQPQKVTASGLATAGRIVSFGYDLAPLIGSSRIVEQWADCPTVAEDFEIAWRFITGRVDRLLDQLAP